MFTQLAKKYSNITWTEVDNTWLYKGECRLDGSFYCGDSVQSFLILDKFSKKIEQISNFAENVFYPGRFKRIWINKKHGKPFFTGAQILQAYPLTDKYIIPSKISSIDSYKVTPQQLLVTRSGTIGKLTFTIEKLSNQLVTEDAIRIEIQNNIERGYVYAYLKSKIGNPLIQQSVFGAVIDHVEPNHIEQIQIPIIDKFDFGKVGSDIVKAFLLRDHANKLIDESQELFYKLLNLPKISEENVQYLGDEKVKAWEIDKWSSRFRLDTSFYHPLAKLTVENLEKSGHNIEKLNIKNNIYELPTYKRVYVKKSFGIPFLSGKNLMESNFSDLKYLSKSPIKNVDDYLIREGMILITMRGTCGNVRLIDQSLNGFGASHNIMRLIPSEEYFGGYIFTFLISDYGKLQMQAKVLGSVVDVLTPEDLSDIYIPFVDMGIQKQIGEKAQKAFEIRTKANEIEEKAIEFLEKKIKESV